MKHKHYIPFLVLILVIVTASAWWIQAQAATTSRTDTFEATGVIEARQAALANEIGGKVIEVLVEEGERVEANQPLLRLDDALLQKQQERAQSELIAAQAALNMLEAGATQDQLDAAQAQLSEAEANLQLAQAVLNNASAGTRPEDLAVDRIKLELARSLYYNSTAVLTTDQLNKLESALTQSKENLARTTRRYEALKKDSSVADYVIVVSQTAVTDAQSAVDAAQQAYDTAQDKATPYYRQIELARTLWQLAELNETQAQARLDGLKSDSKVPTDAIDDAESTLTDAKDLVETTKSAFDELSSGVSATQLNAAWDEVQKAQKELASVVGVSGGSTEVMLAQVDAAMAQHHVATANLSALKNGARDEEIEAARARVNAAQAQLDSLDIQLSKLTIRAPWDGVVLTRSAEIGQLALPGATVIEIGRLDQLELTVYLPEEKFGLIVPGQVVQVYVDAYPNRVFEGTVLRMANEAEFTPTNVQTKEDRTRLVYAVVISLDNPKLELKPGMIADVDFAIGVSK